MTKTQTTSHRSGRQVETVTTVTLDQPIVHLHRTGWNEDGTEFTVVAVTNNVRHFDGEMTQNNHWAITAAGGCISISKTEFAEMSAK